MANETQMKLPAYIGTKIVQAMLMTEAAFARDYRNGAELDHPSSDGYMVIYEDGYKSWSPKDVFERSYRRITAKESSLI